MIRVTNPRSATAVPDWRTRELAFMNLARIHYEARQNRNAIYYYGKVERGGEQWLEALYEAAWAYYRIGDYEQALGNMITLHSPFFQNEYFPESLTVKAIIYYENCRYEEATRPSTTSTDLRAGAATSSRRSPARSSRRRPSTTCSTRSSASRRSRARTRCSIASSSWPSRTRS